MGDLERIRAILAEDAEPFLKSHGGSLEVTDVCGGCVTVRFSGACAGCPSADLSTKSFLEEILRRRAPEIREVRIDRPVDDELLRFAREILRGGRHPE